MDAAMVTLGSLLFISTDTMVGLLINRVIRCQWIPLIYYLIKTKVLPRSKLKTSGMFVVSKEADAIRHPQVVF